MTVVAILRIGDPSSPCCADRCIRAIARSASTLAWRAGRPLEEGLRIEAQCFNRSITDGQTYAGLRQFNERDHPDCLRDTVPVTPGLRRSE